MSTTNRNLTLVPATATPTAAPAEPPDMEQLTDFSAFEGEIFDPTSAEAELERMMKGMLEEVHERRQLLGDKLKEWQPKFTVKEARVSVLQKSLERAEHMRVRSLIDMVKAQLASEAKVRDDLKAQLDRIQAESDRLTSELNAMRVKPWERPQLAVVAPVAQTMDDILRQTVATISATRGRTLGEFVAAYAKSGQGLVQRPLEGGKFACSAPDSVWCCHKDTPCKAMCVVDGNVYHICTSVTSAFWTLLNAGYEEDCIKFTSNEKTARTIAERQQQVSVGSSEPAPAKRKGNMFLTATKPKSDEEIAAERAAHQRLVAEIKACLQGKFPEADHDTIAARVAKCSGDTALDKVKNRAIGLHFEAVKRSGEPDYDDRMKIVLSYAAAAGYDVVQWEELITGEVERRNIESALAREAAIAHKAAYKAAREPVQNGKGKKGKGDDGKGKGKKGRK